MNESPYKDATIARNPAMTTDRLRHAIDSGETGDKVSHPDPAAAPLGTDAEAGGAHPQVVPEDIRRVAEQEPASPGAHQYFIWGLVPLYTIAGFVLLDLGGGLYAFVQHG